MAVHLRPWQPGDEEAAVRWSGDRAFCWANDWTLDLPAERVRAWWRGRGNSAEFLRMIEADGVIVGYAEWQDRTEHTAELGIAIGESRLWGRGIGAQAEKLMVAWAFEELGLQYVWAEVHQPNARSLALMHKIGFRETGRQGEGDYQGRLVPMVQFELTREEFAGR